MENELIEAVWRNNFSRVKSLIKSGANIDCTDEDDITPYHGYTPLMIAIYARNFEIVKFLIKNGADVNTKNIYGLTPISIALALGEFTIVTLLEKRGAKFVSFADKVKYSITDKNRFEKFMEAYGLKTSDIKEATFINPALVYS